MGEEISELNSRPHTTEGELLEERITVYEYEDGFRTTSSVKFDKYLEKQFSELPPSRDYGKIKGVTIKQKKFKEVESSENPHKSRKPDDAETEEKLQEILSDGEE